MSEEMSKALLAERQAAYGRLQGGAPILLAGATYWAVLAGAGALVPGQAWYLIALFGSGAIFPLALFYARLSGNDFMGDRTAVSSVLVPAFIAMLMFWPMAIAALWYATELFVLILAIGLSLHFPVIGWSYGRTALYTAHAVIRTAAVFGLWLAYPDQRLIVVPVVVVAFYLVTVMVVAVDSRRFRPTA